MALLSVLLSTQPSVSTIGEGSFWGQQGFEAMAHWMKTEIATTLVNIWYIVGE